MQAEGSLALVLTLSLTCWVSDDTSPGLGPSDCPSSARAETKAGKVAAKRSRSEIQTEL